MGGGGEGAGGLLAAPGAADDDPQALSVVPMPIASIVRNIAELPTARPIDVRKARLAIVLFFAVIFLSALSGLMILRRLSIVRATLFPRRN